MVSHELKAEGTARDVVRLIQNLRKSSGLEISDRINLWISCSDKIKNSLAPHVNYISEETLTQNLDLGAVLSEDALEIAAVNSLTLDDGDKIRVALEKA